MNQKSMLVALRDFTGSERPFGNVEGQKVYRLLANHIQQHPQARVVGISLSGIEATDASFPRESVVSLAKQLRGKTGIYLTGLKDRDLMDNWNYAAVAREQPLVVWDGDSFEVLGPEMNKATEALVEYVLRQGSVLASQVAADLSLSVQNASTRLKNLVQAGYLLRNEDVAESGGIEYRYQAIH